MTNVLIKAQENIIRKGSSVCGKIISNTWCSCHNRIICTTFEFLVYLVKGMRYFMRSTTQKCARNVALLLVRCGTEIAAVRTRVSVITETCHSFPRYIDAVKHCSTSITQSRRYH